MSDLAVVGGPMTAPEGIGPPWPIYGDIEYVELGAVISSGIWGATGFGPKIAEFNRLWATYCGTARSVALANGTVTMELALRGLGIIPGEEVIVPAWTFMATAAAVLQAGCVPVFVDIDPNSLCLDPAALEAAMSERTRAVIPVHFAGHPCDMDRILEIARRHDLVVIEDAAQAHGATWRTGKMGSFGHCGSYSFQQSKNLQCGEGGSVVTNDEDLADQLHFSLSKFGRGRGSAYAPFEHYELAGNACMTEFQAAVALAQLTRLEEQTQRREQNAFALRQGLEDIDGITPLPIDERVTRHGNHLFVFRYAAEAFSGLARRQFISAINAEGVPCFGLYPRPLYEEAMYDRERMTVANTDLNIRTTDCPETQSACQQVLAFPQSLLLARTSQMDLVGAALRKIQKHSDLLVR